MSYHAQDILNKLCSIVSRLLFSFRAGKMSVVLIFNICNAYEIVAYEWLYLQYWGRVKMLDMASKIAVSFNCVS